MQVYQVFSGEDYEGGSVQETFVDKIDAIKFAQVYALKCRMKWNDEHQEWRKGCSYIVVNTIKICKSLEDSEYYNKLQ